MDRILAPQLRERGVRHRVDESVVVGQIYVAERLRHLGLDLEVLQVLGDLPVRDPRAMALDLESLDRQEGLDDLVPQCRAEHVIALERVERLLERARKGVAGRPEVEPVGVTG